MIAVLALLGGVGGVVRMSVAAILAGILAYGIGHMTGASSGRAALQSEITSNALAAEKERVSDDATLSKLSDADLCRRAMRASGMPDDLCGGL